MAGQGAIITKSITNVSVSLTQTTEPDTPLFEFDAGNLPLRLHQLNISVNSGFQANAYYKIVIDGISQQANAFQPWNAAAAILNVVPTGKFLPVNSQGSIKIYAYNPTGQSTQAMSFSVDLMAEVIDI